MKFSERMGLSKNEKQIQVDFVDNDLRTALWNQLDLGLFESDRLKEWDFDDTALKRMKYIFSVLWMNFYHKTYDSLPTSEWDMYQFLRNDFFACAWYEVYDIIEEIIKCIKHMTHIELLYEIGTLQEGLNYQLEKENSAYRIIDGIVCGIIDPQAIEQVETALKDNDFPQVKTHLTRALELLSDKQNPDYRNSIKESISAVESIAILLSRKEKATLGDALAEIERNGKIHPSLKKGFSNIYGYTSNDDGIRHALMEESNLEKADAHLFFLLCTVFVNYLKTKF